MPLSHHDAASALPALEDVQLLHAALDMLRSSARITLYHIHDPTLRLNNGSEVSCHLSKVCDALRDAQHIALTLLHLCQERIRLTPCL